MKIILNTKIPMLYDFLRVIAIEHNSINFIEKYKNNNLYISKQVIKAIEYIWNGLDINALGVSLFFTQNDERSCYIYFKHDSHIHEFDSLNDFIDAAFSGPLEDLQLSILEYYDVKDRPEDYYKNLLSNQDQLFSHINALDTSQKLKWELMALFINPNEILASIKQFCHRVKRKIKNVYKQNAIFINEFKKSLSEKIKKDSNNLLSIELKNLINPAHIDNAESLVISYSFINEFLCQTYPLKDIKRVVIIGTMYEKLLNEIKRPDNSESKEIFFKAIADKHRIQIIRLILNKSMYVAEIASKMKMLITTMTYHLDILLAAKIIFSRRQGKRIYYIVNKEYVTNYLKSIIANIDMDKF